MLTDVREGLLQALNDLHERLPLFERPPEDLSSLEGKTVSGDRAAPPAACVSPSSATCPGLTVEAANQSALGAGAKIVGSTAFKLSAERLREIESLRPDMILLTGGVDGGDTETILHNARMLAQSALSVPIVVAGNRAAAQEVSRNFASKAAKKSGCVDNVMPKAGTLAVESAREEIRQLFMERITRAKGLDQVKEFVPVVLPTPMAVLEGLRLGADGTAEEKGWGDMLVVDVGGATTDVHSIGYGLPGGRKCDRPGPGRGLRETNGRRGSGHSLQCGDYS